MPPRLLGTNHAAWLITEKANASELGTAKTASADTQSHWYVPTNPGEDGIATPRFTTTVRNAI